jgi:DNA adenine methylase
VFENTRFVLRRQLASTILGLVPEHRLYCEPFFGGGAVFFAKEPSAVEVINDCNGELVNFYEVLRRDFPALEREIAASLHSRRQHREARVIYENPAMFDRIKRAWAVWTLANSSYSCDLDTSFGYDRNGTTSLKLRNKRAEFAASYAARLQNTQIECCDALRVIESRDVPDAFFYLDPPYVGTDQGHYDGYSQADFDALLRLLEKLKGKFFLSSFRNAALRECSARNGWHTVELRMAKPMTHSSETCRKKIEVFTANYPVAVTLDSRSKKEKEMVTEGEAGEK